MVGARARDSGCAGRDGVDVAVIGGEVDRRRWCPRHDDRRRSPTTAPPSRRAARAACTTRCTSTRPGTRSSASTEAVAAHPFGVVGAAEAVADVGTHGRRRRDHVAITRTEPAVGGDVDARDAGGGERAGEALLAVREQVHDVEACPTPARRPPRTDARMRQAGRPRGTACVAPSRRPWSRLQPPQHGEHAPVVLGAGGRSSLVKMLLTCFSTAPSLTTSACAIAAFDRPSAISDEHLALAGREPVERVALPGAGEQLRDHLRVERRCRRRRPGAARRRSRARRRRGP